MASVSWALAIPYWELNEHGIIYLREKLHKSPLKAVHVPKDDEQNEYLTLRDFLKNHFYLIEVAKDFYQKCQYLGDVEITAKLREVRGERLMFGDEFRYNLIQTRQSLDSKISAFIKRCARDLIESEKADDVIVDLVGQLLLGFSVPPGAWETTVRGKRRCVRYWRNGESTVEHCYLQSRIGAKLMPSACAPV